MAHEMQTTPPVRRVLIVFPQTTHPVVNGSQVRVNRLLRHLSSDLSWEVDFFATQGLLRRESWGPNMDRLRKIFIPKPAAGTGPNQGLFRFPHIRAALHKGFIEGVYKDLRDLVKRFLRARGNGAGNAPTFETLSYVNEALCSVAAQRQLANPSPVSERLKRYDADYMRDCLRHIIATEKYDVVIVNYVWLSNLLGDLLDTPQRPLLVCDTIDVQYVREARLQAFRGPAEFDQESEKQLELSLLGKYDALLTITEVDRQELLAQVAPTPVCTVLVETELPAGGEMTPERFAERREQQHTYDLIFLGAANEANRLAAVVLLENHVPRLRQAYPALRVAMAGRICEDLHVRRAAHQPGVELLGYVPSVDDFYASGRVLAAPIEAGGGVKVKVLEAMAHAVAVVTTPIGAEGTPLEDGVHGYITESDEAFVARTLELLNDPAHLERLSLAAQACVRDKLNPEMVYEGLDAQLEQWLDR